MCLARAHTRTHVPIHDYLSCMHDPSLVQALRLSFFASDLAHVLGMAAEITPEQVAELIRSCEAIINPQPVSAAAVAQQAPMTPPIVASAVPETPFPWKAAPIEPRPWKKPKSEAFLPVPRPAVGPPRPPAGPPPTHLMASGPLADPPPATHAAGLGPIAAAPPPIQLQSSKAAGPPPPPAKVAGPPPPPPPVKVAAELPARPAHISLERMELLAKCRIPVPPPPKGQIGMTAKCADPGSAEPTVLAEELRTKPHGPRGSGENSSWHTAWHRAKNRGPEALALFLSVWPKPRPPSKRQ